MDILEDFDLDEARVQQVVGTAVAPSVEAMEDILEDFDLDDVPVPAQHVVPTVSLPSLGKGPTVGDFDLDSLAVATPVHLQRVASTVTPYLPSGGIPSGSPAAQRNKSGSVAKVSAPPTVSKPSAADAKSSKQPKKGAGKPKKGEKPKQGQPSAVNENDDKISRLDIVYHLLEDVWAAPLRDYSDEAKQNSFVSPSKWWHSISVWVARLLLAGMAAATFLAILFSTRMWYDVSVHSYHRAIQFQGTIQITASDCYVRFLRNNCNVTQQAFPDFNVATTKAVDSKTGIQTISFSAAAPRGCRVALCYDDKLDQLFGNVSVSTLRATVDVVDFPLTWNMSITSASNDDASRVIVSNTSATVKLASGVVIVDRVSSFVNVTVANLFGPVYIIAQAPSALSSIAPPTITLDGSLVNGTVPKSNFSSVATNGSAPLPVCAMKSMLGFLPQQVKTLNQISDPVPPWAVPSGAVSIQAATSLYLMPNGLFNFSSELASFSMTASSVDVSPSVLTSINGTKEWIDRFAMSDFIQNIEVIAPTIGFNLLNSNREILFNFGPVLLALVSFWMLSPTNRKLPTPLSHYSCAPIMNYDRIGSLTNTIDMMTVDQMAAAFYNPVPLELAYNVFQNIQKLQFSRGITTSTTIYVGLDKGTYERPGWYEIVKVFDSYQTNKLQPSIVGYIVLGLSLTVSLLLTLFLLLAVLTFRNDLVRLVFMHKKRNRNRMLLADDPGTCQYHYHFGFSFLNGWASIFVVNVIERLAPTWFLFKLQVSTFLALFCAKSSNNHVPISVFMKHICAYRNLTFRGAVPLEDEEKLAEVLRSCYWPDGSKIEVTMEEVSFILGITPAFGSSAAMETAFNDTQCVTNNTADEVTVLEVMREAKMEEVSVLAEADFRGLGKTKKKVLVLRRTDIEPLTCQQNKDKLFELVSMNEYNCSGIPSLYHLRFGGGMFGTIGRGSTFREAIVRYGTLGVLMLTQMITYIASAVTPFVFLLLMVVWTQVENLKYTSMSSSVDFQHFLWVLFIKDAIVDNGYDLIPYFFIPVSMVFICEPFLLAIQQFALGAGLSSGSFAGNMLRGPSFVVLSIGVFFRALTMIAASALALVLAFYFTLVLQWWVLGAIIAPNVMLPFATASFMIVGTGISTFRELKSSRTQLLNQLKEKVTNRLLAQLKQCPIQLPIIDSDAASAFQVVSQINMQLLCDLEQLKPEAITKLSTIVGIPPEAAQVAVLISTRNGGEALQSVVASFCERLQVPEKARGLVVVVAVIALDGAVPPQLMKTVVTQLVPGDFVPFVKQFDGLIRLVVEFVLEVVLRKPSGSSKSPSPGQQSARIRQLLPTVSIELVGTILRIVLSGRVRVDDADPLSYLHGSEAEGAAVEYLPTSKGLPDFVDCLMAFLSDVMSSCASPEKGFLPHKLVARLAEMFVSLASVGVFPPTFLPMAKGCANIAKRASSTSSSSSSGPQLSSSAELFEMLVPFADAVFAICPDAMLVALPIVAPLLGTDVASLSLRFGETGRKYLEKNAVLVIPDSVLTVISVLNSLRSLCTPEFVVEGLRMKAEMEQVLRKCTIDDLKSKSTTERGSSLVAALQAVVLSILGGQKSSSAPKIAIDKKMLQEFPKVEVIIAAVENLGAFIKQNQPMERTRFELSMILALPVFSSFISPIIIDALFPTVCADLGAPLNGDVVDELDPFESSGDESNDSHDLATPLIPAVVEMSNKGSGGVESAYRLRVHIANVVPYKFGSGVNECTNLFQQYFLEELRQRTLPSGAHAPRNEYLHPLVRELLFPPWMPDDLSEGDDRNLSQVIDHLFREGTPPPEYKFFEKLSEMLPKTPGLDTMTRELANVVFLLGSSAYRLTQNVGLDIINFERVADERSIHHACSILTNLDIQKNDSEFSMKLATLCLHIGDSVAADEGAFALLLRAVYPPEDKKSHKPPQSFEAFLKMDEPPASHPYHSLSFEARHVVVAYLKKCREALNPRVVTSIASITSLGQSAPPPPPPIPPKMAFAVLCAFRQHTPPDVFEAVSKALFPADVQVPVQRLWKVLTTPLWRAATAEWTEAVAMLRRQSIPTAFAMPLLSLAFAHHGFQQSVVVHILSLLLHRKPQATIAALSVHLSTLFSEYQEHYVRKVGGGKKDTNEGIAAFRAIASFVTGKSNDRNEIRKREILAFAQNCLVEANSEDGKNVIRRAESDPSVLYPTLMAAVRVGGSFDAEVNAISNVLLAVAARRKSSIIHASFSLMAAIAKKVGVQVSRDVFDNVLSPSFSVMIVAVYSMATGDGKLTDRAVLTFIEMLRCGVHHFQQPVDKKKPLARIRPHIASLLSYFVDIVEHRLKGLPGLPLPKGDKGKSKEPSRGVVRLVRSVISIALEIHESDIGSTLKEQLSEGWWTNVERLCAAVFNSDKSTPTGREVVEFVSVTISTLTVVAGLDGEEVRVVVSLVTSVVSTLVDAGQSHVQKLQSLLVLLLPASQEMTLIRKLIAVIVDGASGDFTAIPQLLELLGMSLSPGDKDKIVAALNVLKKLGEGTLSLSDVGEAATNAVINKVADELFEQIDANKNGCISFDRFMSLVNHIGIELSEADAKQAFSKVDTSGDGTIDKEEFRQTIPLMKDMIVDFVIGRMGLRPGQVIVFVVLLLVFLAFFLSFILLGMSTFSSGDVFTAAIGGVMPMACNGLTGMSGSIDAIVGEAERVLNSVIPSL